MDRLTKAATGLLDTCALRYPASGSSTYKVVFSAFPFEAVPRTSASPSNAYTLMQRIMGWFGLEKPSAPEYMHGDANGDEEITVDDVVFLINYLYRDDIPPTPLLAGDANCDGEVETSDVVYLINYLYRGGDPPPC